ncbi:MAG TPA: 30S ribosomal protein S20 [Candidatus Acidoferrales bacterium]|nr:30S ribosomal protein S20 [Candidatus Acidoferrales bacterium]
MANTSSARKRIRSAARKHERNRRVRSSVRTAVVKARRVIDGAEEGSREELLKLATSALDKASEHGVLHKRNVSRRKSRLMRSAAKTAVPGTAAVKAPKATTKRASAQGTKPKAKAGSTSRKAAAPKAGRPATKTERTSSSQRRAAGSTSKERKES